MNRWVMIAGVLVGGCGESLVADPADTRGQPEVGMGCEEGALIGLEVGLCAPDFTLPDSEGVLTSLSSFRGKVALVDIAALW
jgi:cytochrome oxidase Cu insertion factor (SCO1/SenC/PrrC family)